MKIIKFSFLCFVLILINSCAPNESGNADSIRISNIQGCGHISPYKNLQVTGVEGVVTHKFKSGFTMQSLIYDERECSSEALFVYTATYPDVFPGQLVSVNGKVEEFYEGNEEYHNLSRTEIHDPIIKILQGRISLPKYISIHDGKEVTPDRFIDRDPEFNVTIDGLDYYESLEFMLVGVESGIVVGPKNSYNEFIVLPNTKLKNNLSSTNGNLLLQDGDQNPEVVMVDVASSFTQKVNVGDQFSSPIVGIMDYSFGNYKIWTINDPEIKAIKCEKEFLQSNDNESLSTVSYNIENYSQFDDEQKVKGISCQIAIDLASPDIVVLQEVLDDSGTENDNVVTAQATLERLVSEIRSCGGPEYLHSDNPPENNKDGGIEGGNIRSVVLYRPDRGLSLDHPDTTIHGLAIRNSEIVIGENPYRFAQNESVFWGTRKPTAWLFTWRGEKILIIGVHLVSQAATSPTWGNVQPPVKPEQSKRETQARLISESIEKFHELADDLHIIVAGDLNDYPWSNTLTELTSDKMKNPSYIEPDSERYSYIFEGNSFQFDYILVDPDLEKRILNYKIPHINTPYSHETRLSDHDPVYIQFSWK
jgi:hypothetical protein